MKNILFVIIISIAGLIYKSCGIVYHAITPDGIYGTVKIDSLKYIDQLEVSVQSWLSYYTWILQNKGYDSAQAVLPDSTAIPKEVWAYIKLGSTKFNKRIGRSTLKPIGYFCQKCKEHFNYSDFLDTKPETCPYLRYPITGLTFEQVTDFCKWRTEQLGEEIYEFRLPTEAEWIRFAKGDVDDLKIAHGMPDSIINEGCVHFNYKVTDPCKDCNKLELDKTELLPSAIFDLEINEAYDIFGNASEMTSNKGVAKGGSYATYASQCHYDSVQHYDKPEAWLGFRCIAIKKKK